MKRNNKFYIALGFAALGLVACNDDDNSNNDDNVTVVPQDFVIPDAEATAIAQTYSDLARTNYTEAIDLAETMQTAINTFVAAPSADGFEAAKQAWLTAREVYGVSEAFRLADGPIDRIDENGVEGPEGLLNSWPMDEGFVDYIEDDLESGFVNDASFVLSAEALEAQNGAVEETEVSVGWHAIEFLLWGQDNDDQLDATAGQRAYTDYLTSDEATAVNGDRRGQYLVIITDLLIENLKFVLNEWSEGENYDATFAALSNEQLLTNILGGIGKFASGELRGERMVPGFDVGAQEDEHSCFSDNTHIDIAKNYEGVSNIYFGEYNGESLNGISPSQLVAMADAEVAAEVEAAFDAADAAVLAATTGDAVPFDRAILSVDQGNTAERRALISEAISALGVLGVQITNAAAVIGLEVTAELE